MVAWQFWLRASFNSNHLPTFGSLILEHVYNMYSKISTLFMNAPFVRKTSCTCQVMRNGVLHVRLPSCASGCGRCREEHSQNTTQPPFFSLYNYSYSSYLRRLKCRYSVSLISNEMGMDCSRTTWHVPSDVKIDGQRRGSYGIPVWIQDQLLICTERCFRHPFTSISV